MDLQKLWQDFDNSPLVRREFAGNALPVWLIAVAAFLAAAFVLRLAVGIVRKRARPSPNVAILIWRGPSPVWRPQRSGGFC